MSPLYRQFEKIITRFIKKAPQLQSEIESYPRQTQALDPPESPIQSEEDQLERTIAPQTQNPYGKRYL